MKREARRSLRNKFRNKLRRTPGYLPWVERARARVRARQFIQGYLMRSGLLQRVRVRLAIWSAEPGPGSDSEAPRHRPPRSGNGAPGGHRFNPDSRRSAMERRSLDRGPRQYGPRQYEPPPPHAGPRAEESPPRLTDEMRMGKSWLAHVGWEVLPRDEAEEILLLNVKTGAVRAAPWICLRDDDAKPYFANLITGVTQWLPPDGWMDGWVTRLYRPLTGKQVSVQQGKVTIPSDELKWNVFQGTASLEGTTDAREGYTGRGCMLKCLGIEMRLRVEGGAPYRYRREHGKPQYPPDWFDTKQTYPEWALEEWMRSGDRNCDQVSFGGVPVSVEVLRLANGLDSTSR